MAMQADQTTLPGRPSQVLQSNIPQESQVALTGYVLEHFMFVSEINEQGC